jgi:hypothetical protein
MASEPASFASLTLTTVLGAWDTSRKAHTVHIVHHFSCCILCHLGPLGCELCSLPLDQIKEHKLYNVVNTYYVVKPLKDTAEICYRDEVGRYDSFTESSSRGKLLSVKSYGVPRGHSKGKNQFSFSHKTLLECRLQAAEGEQITLLKSKAINVERLLCGHQPTESTRSFGSLSLAKEWVDDCILQHGMYCPPPTAWKPTRLIGIWPTPMTSRFPGVVGYPRLVVMAEEEGAPTASYMTLSHRWGE